MDEREGDLVRSLYELQIELYDTQGAEIAALGQANAALKRSHEVIAKMLQVLGELVRPH